VSNAFGIGPSALANPIGTNTAMPTGGAASSPVSVANAALASAASPSATGSTASTKIAPTQGWYVFAGIIVGVSLSTTRAAPLVVGILSLALIYQVSALLMHTPPSTTAPSLSSLIKKP
jgi:hypothetical protein